MYRPKCLARTYRYSARHKRRLVQKANEKTAERIKLQILDLLKTEGNSLSENVENLSPAAQVYKEVDSKRVIQTTTAEKPVNRAKHTLVLKESENPYIIENYATDRAGYDEINDALIFEDEEFYYRYSDCNDSDKEISEDEGNNVSVTDESIQEICKKISSQLTHVFAQWSIECFVAKNAQKKFLHKVREEIPLLKLPLDPRTINKAPRKGVIHQIKGGDYCHFGLKPVLEKIIHDQTLLGIENDKIELLINIDGAPTGKDAEKNLWPILCSDKLTRRVYIIGVYCGKAKPDDVDEYLSFFVDEAVFFVNNGLCVDDKKYSVLIDGFIMDAPAKAYILGVKCHSGYFSCTKCDIEGENVECVCFPGKIGVLRTDEKFRAFKDYRAQGYQLIETPLMRIPKLNLVSQVPIDSMHLLSGVTRKMVLIWKHSSTRHRLSIAQLNKISNALLGIKPFVPYEFARKPRDLRYIKQYKCTELRELQNYTGPVALQGRVSKKVYTNFITLHVIVSICSNPILCRIPAWIDYAEKLSEQFVKKFQDLYRSRYVSHNVHNVQHLPNDVRTYGELERFSAYDFENFIARIKRMLKSCNKIPQQLINRCAEIELLKEKLPNLAGKDVPDLRQPHENGPLPSIFQATLQYKVGIFFGSFKINCDDAKNNYLYINNQYYIEVLNIIKSDDDVYVVGRTLKVVGSLYTKPCLSSKLGINVLNLRLPSSEIQYWNISEITAKLFMMPFKGNFVAFPILHTIRSSMEK